MGTGTGSSLWVRVRVWVRNFAPGSGSGYGYGYYKSAAMLVSFCMAGYGKIQQNVSFFFFNLIHITLPNYD